MQKRQSHPWLEYVPGSRRPRVRLERQCLLLKSRLSLASVQIALLLAGYLLFCLLPLAFGLVTLTGFAVLPLLLVPPVGYLIYWLVWNEFHH